MRRNELKIRKTRLWSALLFGMLTSMGILMTGCGTFHTDVNEEINVSDPGVSVPEMPDTSEPADLSLKNPENAGAEFTPELPENSAQGYMPAQQFHLLKNPAYESDPWYYVNELTDPLHTPEYTFSMDSLKRLEY